MSIFSSERGHRFSRISRIGNKKVHAKARRRRAEGAKKKGSADYADYTEQEGAVRRVMFIVTNESIRPELL